MPESGRAFRIGRDKHWVAKRSSADASTRPNAKGPHSAKCDAIMEQRPELQKAFKDIIAFFGHLEEKALGPEAVTPTYYISHLGTLPDYQRKGLAGALLNMAKQKAKAEGKTLTLLTMTEPNVSVATWLRVAADGLQVKYYEKFGFKNLYYEEITLNGILTRWWVMAVDPADS